MIHIESFILLPYIHILVTTRLALGRVIRRRESVLHQTGIEMFSSNIFWSKEFSNILHCNNAVCWR